MVSENMNEKIIIEANANGDKLSFIGKLHEDNSWDSKSFFELYDAIHGLTFKINELDRNIVSNIYKISSFILNSLIHHMDENDLYEIQNLNEIEVNDFVERLNVVVAGFFAGKPPKEELFDDDLR